MHPLICTATPTFHKAPWILYDASEKAPNHIKKKTKNHLIWSLKSAIKED